MKHAPGPWFVRGMHIEDMCGRYVADIKLDNEDPEAAANARLIAAAPELLEALANLLDVWPNHGKVPGWVDRWMKAQSKGIAAIYKATGEH